MSIDVQWDNTEKTVIQWIFSGTWTWKEFGEVQVQFHAMLGSVDHPVDVIADLRDTSSLPPNSFAEYRNYDRKDAPNRDRVILVTTNQFICTMAKAFNQMFPDQPTHFILATSLNEAREMLMRPSYRRSETR